VVSQIVIPHRKEKPPSLTVSWTGAMILINLKGKVGGQGVGATGRPYLVI
jgi:hypothetical protein